MKLRNKALCDFAEQYANWVHPEIIITDCRDPADNMFLELAVEGQADIIISGDNDLLSLNPFRGIKIITAAEFLKSS